MNSEEKFRFYKTKTDLANQKLMTAIAQFSLELNTVFSLLKSPCELEFKYNEQPRDTVLPTRNDNDS